MPKTITQLPAADIVSRSALVAVDNAAGTETQKVTLGQVADLYRLPQQNPPGMGRFITIIDGSVQFKTTTGYGAVLWWDGSVQVIGNGVPSNTIVAFKTSPTTGNWSRSSPKEIFFWSCTSGNATQSGDLTEAAVYNATLAEVAGNGELTQLNLSAIETLSLGGCSKLQYLSCDGSRLRSVDLSPCPLLAQISVTNCPLTSIDISTAPLLTALYLNDTLISAIDLSNNLAIVNLNLNNTQLTSLDISGLTALDWFRANNCLLTSVRAVGVSAGGFKHNAGIDVQNNLLSAAALNQLYTDLAPAGVVDFFNPYAINVTGNPGAASSNPTIATAKGYTVIGV